ncbi:TetR/AcrR family transcriptional regulator [Rhodococcus coprophilus]|uniref:TetR family transcriptional regulator n=1 Tax=Rhodococcus coprophilus TaxID=38310 RepID=A0A2X4U7G8_9NOCA|nr:TetR/AcrR family transcriptional regulator C-terminal domain-containing protein [Rhodococcus coprophilus]MBM7460845.1 AcrR family transcriptional regulator [Rhodococcus coprophilus]SQI28650.1 TetR family transcriptional regulator [Rhodococcus coprophilus]
MARELLDLLWRDHPAARQGGARGPRAKVTTSQAVDAAITLADTEGLEQLTVRRLAAELGISGMALYTHVGSRDDLLVLMADAVHGSAPRRPYLGSDWRTRVRQLTDADLALYGGHEWLLDVSDQRVSLGPGTIAKYDHDLHAFDHTGVSDVDRDAALTFVADFTRAAARARRPDPHAADMAEVWSAWRARLASYVGNDFPLARRVGAAAGAVLNTSYSPEASWEFGRERVLDALAMLFRAGSDDSGPSL